ncbi:hypothetical protein McanMca71_003772 [Microsporum canis]|uniref:DUF1772-domain-containing protein n=1 Tax=Arthroderma otae (strain ATCC MYA-4605 / CBS 113480) TaxID=554155 RepID=C5FT55_ARTOC|nr:conserved hypothetical protein [Microsporum canis CBS 113480]EEQ33058.1 conserved hypothetical protein [Microsporum canis CBS 113480]
MPDVSSCVRTAQVVGLTASGMMAGAIISYSTVLIPSITLPAGSGPASYDSNHKPGTPISHIATQWRHAYNIGKSSMPFCAIGAGSAYAYLAYVFRHETTLRVADVRTSNWYLLASGLVMSIIPYTLMVMSPTNNSLLSRAEVTDAEAMTGVSKAKEAASRASDSKATREDVEVLNWLKGWAELNVVRGLFPLAATLSALYATLY